MPIKTTVLALKYVKNTTNFLSGGWFNVKILTVHSDITNEKRIFKTEFHILHKRQKSAFSFFFKKIIESNPRIYTLWCAVTAKIKMQDEIHFSKYFLHILKYKKIRREEEAAFKKGIKIILISMQIKNF